MSFWRGGVAAAVALLCFQMPGWSCDLASAASTRWSTLRSGGISWLVSPCGERFFSVGVNVVDGGASGAALTRPHYHWAETAPDLDSWIAATRERLSQWGFNSVGAWSLAPDRLKLPTVINLELGRLARFHWFDPFDPATADRMREEARKLTAPYRASSYRLGYFSDNEVGWWGGALFVFYSARPASNYTKQRWVAELERRYGDDWARFTADFVPPPEVGSWDELRHSEKPTRLRPGGDGSAAVRHWTEVVAERYYALAREALHEADPDALFLGDRLPIYYDPMALKAEARHVDVIASNYNVDSPEGWIAPYYLDGMAALTGGKPVLISEWFFAARENRTGNRNNGHLMTVETQAQRAAGAAAAASAFAARPEIVGLHWFQYYDYPVGGRADAEDYNFGLVDIHDQPYRPLVDTLAVVDSQLAAEHARGAPILRQTLDEFTVPQAAIDPDKPSLIDWPKPESLLPKLQAAPGEVAFGEVYLSWSPAGLAFATIGQDYYDIDLLAYAGEFPLSEAYRVELDVDGGAGPKRFTLYFIPPRTKVRDHPPMAARLCAGAPAEHQATSCPGVQGGRALYFGADQPRIAAQALLPWAALGLDGPPRDRRVRVEVAASAWFRSRWMSLSGRPPVEASAHPERWASIALGGAPDPSAKGRRPER